MLQERTRGNRRSVAQEITKIIEDTLAAGEKVSILELRGLGKEAWRDLDAAAYVDTERRTWD